MSFATPLRGSRLLVVLLLILPGVGCSAVGGGTPPGEVAPSLPSVAGEWSGAVTVEGQTLPGTMEVTQRGADLEVAFRSAELGLVAEGSGSVLPDSTVSMQLAYDLQCPGTARLDGRMTTGGTLLGGTLVANDCTGEITGSFRLRR